MGYESRISTKGQLVVPKAVRERHGLDAGTCVEFVERNGALILRRIPQATSDHPSPAVVFARIAALSSYRGPYVSDADIHRATEDTAIENDTNRQAIG